jgi:hypothetical protein
MTWGAFARTLALAATLLCSGCVALGGVERITGNVDQSAGTARNNSLLLNIVRASREEPLYFFQVGAVHGQPTQDLKLTIPSVTFGPHQVDTQRNFTLGNVLDLSSQNSFDVSPLATSEFYKGMLAPLDLVEVNLLLKQGYPRELVYRLVVQDITVVDKNGEHRFLNDPNAQGYSEGFNKFLAIALNEGLTTESYSIRVPDDDSKDQKFKHVGWARLCFDSALMDAEKRKELTGRLRPELCGERPAPGEEAQAADANRPDKPTGNEPKKPARSRTDKTGAAHANKSGGADADKPTPPPGLLRAYDECATVAAAKSAGSKGNGAGGAPNAAVAGPKNYVCGDLGGGNYFVVQLNTRSLYGIFRFLGANLAHHNEIALLGAGGDEPKVHDGPLLDIRQGRGGDCFAAAAVGHEHYCVPRDRAENLKATFSIINALQALKTSPGDIPTTPVFRLE